MNFLIQTCRSRFKTFLLAFITLFLFANNLISKDIGADSARIIATNFVNQKFGFESVQLNLIDVEDIIYQGQTVIHVVNFPSNFGFVLVSADQNAEPVLGFVPGFKFVNMESLPQSFQNVLLDYSKQIIDIRQRNLIASTSIISKWEKYYNNFKTKAPSSSVGPLLTTIWSQGCGFNDSCPVDPGGPCQNAVTGCVATAMAQVMNYHNWPPNGSGSHSYTSNYGQLTANFSATTYNWALMPDTLTSQTPANMVGSLAQLMSHCGISVDMMYSGGSSGAYSPDAERAFFHFFNYDPALEMKHRDNYPDSVWRQMLIYELDNQRPLYYDGSGSGGHAFVCDGYQAGEFFHFNWGWNGSHNGYFLATNLNPGGMNFSMYNSAIFNLKPLNPVACSGQTTILSTKAGHISDGSSYQNYNNNTNCSWLIQPNNAVTISLDFYNFDLGIGDTVYIYDGASINSPLLAKYHSGNIPTSLFSSAGSLFVVFTSNGSSTGQGWSASYRSEFCGGTTILTSQSGQITDGSGSDLYNNAVNCSWLISAPNSISIELNFTSFSTESGFDFVSIYDGQNSNGQLLGSFSGSNLPQTISANSGNMYINFTTDGGVVDQGWEANYVVCNNLPSPFVSSSLFCPGDSVLLVAPVGQNIVDWYFGPVSFADDDSIYVTAAGYYSYSTTSAICGNLVSPMVSVNNFQSPNFSMPADTTICIYNALSLNFMGYGAYYWFDGTTSSDIILSSSNLVLGANNVWLEVIDTNGCSYADSTTVTMDICEGISETQVGKFTIYPTIANDFINVSANNSFDIKNITVYSIDGKELFSVDSENEINCKVDVRMLQKGSYFVEISTSETTYQLTFIKM